MTALHIVYATDSRYLFPTQVAVASALAWASCRERLHVVLLDCGLTDGEWRAFSGRLRELFGTAFALSRHIVDMDTYSDLKSWHTSKGIYARLEIPAILKDVDWCVYADGDTLFCQDPLALEKIWDPGMALMGHVDPPRREQEAWHRARGLPWHYETYVCAGFILMNLDWFRKNDGAKKCFGLLARHPDMPFNDQDVLNIVCEGRIGLLPDEWGATSYYFRREMKPGCIHFAGSPPWAVLVPGKEKTSMPSTRRIWIDFAWRVMKIAPWEILRCSKQSYWRARILSRAVGFAYRTLSRIPGTRWYRRCNGVLYDYWPRKKELSFLPQCPVCREGGILC